MKAPLNIIFHFYIGPNRPEGIVLIYLSPNVLIPFISPNCVPYNIAGSAYTGFIESFLVGILATAN